MTDVLPVEVLPLVLPSLSPSASAPVDVLPPVVLGPLVEELPAELPVLAEPLLLAPVAALFPQPESPSAAPTSNTITATIPKR